MFGGSALAYPVVLTLPIRDVVRATPRARIARLDLNGHPFDYAPGQAVAIASHGQENRRPYSIAAAPEDARRERCLELLIGVDADGTPGAELALDPGQLVDVEGRSARSRFRQCPTSAASCSSPAGPESRRFDRCCAMR
jgi:NAD(P)H-flavin reductase